MAGRQGSRAAVADDAGHPEVGQVYTLILPGVVMKPTKF